MIYDIQQSTLRMLSKPYDMSFNFVKPVWNMSHVVRRNVCCVNVCSVTVWHSGGALVTINVVALRWARLVLGWVTAGSSRVRTISVFNQPPRLTQPGHLFVVSKMNTSERYKGVNKYTTRCTSPPLCVNLVSTETEITAAQWAYMWLGKGLHCFDRGSKMTSRSEWERTDRFDPIFPIRAYGSFATCIGPDSHVSQI